MRQLSLALLKVLDKGWITCESFQDGKTTERVLIVAAPEQWIDRILEPLTDPVSWGLLKAMIERLVGINALDGTEADVVFLSLAYPGARDGAM